MSTPKITPEELAAWADGEVTGARAAEIAAAVQVNPALQAKVDAHRALRDRLSAHFAPIAEQPVPEHLAAMLRGTPTAANDQVEKPEGSAEVMNFTDAKRKVEAKPKVPRWGWIAGPALAATLALAVFIPGGGGDISRDDPQLAAALDSQLVASQSADAENIILLSFENEDGEFCRAYSQPDQSGIACKERGGWSSRALAEAQRADSTEFRQAGAEEILATAQEMAAGDALSAEEEEAARAAGWR